MTQQQDKLMEAHKSITQLKNLTLIIKLLFTPPKKIMQDNNCNINQALEKIDKAYDFLQNYGILYINQATDNIKPIIEQLIFKEALTDNNKTT